jgi:molybdopterin-guanine dinucleotide biosynthesis protein
MSAKSKYSIEATTEPVIKDLPAVNDTYQDGEILIAGVAEAGGLSSAGIGTGEFIGVSNQGETLPISNLVSSNQGAILTGTQAAGTIDTLKTIINPSAVYAVEYSQGGEQTAVSYADTLAIFPDGAAATGHPGFGGGWLWSDLGELDYVVSSSLNAGNTDYVLVTGTNTASTTAIIIYPSGSGITYPIELTTDALTIDAAQADIGVAGTNAITGVVLENRIESKTMGSEILRPNSPGGIGTQPSSNIGNQGVRTRGTGSTDGARAFAYVRFNSVLSA